MCVVCRDGIGKQDARVRCKRTVMAVHGASWLCACEETNTTTTTGKDRWRLCLFRREGFTVNLLLPMRYIRARNRSFFFSLISSPAPKQSPKETTPEAPYLIGVTIGSGMPACGLHREWKLRTAGDDTGPVEHHKCRVFRDKGQNSSS